MRLCEITTWLDEDSGATLQEIRPISQEQPSARPISNPGASVSDGTPEKGEKRQFHGQGQAQSRYPEGVISLTYGYRIEAATVEEAFAGVEQADKDAREAAVKDFERQRTKAVLSGRIALPRSGLNRLTLPPGNGG